MKITDRNVQKRGSSKQLVVVFHGYTYGPSKLKDVIKTIKEKKPDADLLVPYYPSWLFSNADPIEITENLLFIIDEAVENRKKEGQGEYDEIILIGFSMGALLARKIYVFACGKTEDSKTDLEIKAMDWSDKVSRIILLAGMNRGWSVRPKPKQMGWLRCLGIRFMSKIGWLFGFGKLVRSVKRGSPFVTNLRIQWLSVIYDDKVPVPPTIQLLGDIDDIVSSKDSIDLESGADFIYLKLLNTGHLNLLDFKGEYGKARMEKFTEALITPVKDLKSQFKSTSDRNETVEKVVFLMHGIRDWGHWLAGLRESIKKIAQQKQITTKVITSSYGYFPMLRFLFLSERQKNVRWFMDEYTEALARYPNAKMEFIGHSNGTYLLASALKNYEACKFNNIVFAGSVVPTYFPWDKHIDRDRVKAVRNYVATRDLVVGIFPGLFESLGLSDLGSAGHNGFQDNTGKEYAVTFIEGGHGAAIRNEKNYDAMAQFIFNGSDSEVPRSLYSDKQKSFAVWVSKLNWVVWLVLFFIILGVGLIIFQTFGWMWASGYAAILLILLFTL